LFLSAQLGDRRTQEVEVTFESNWDVVKVNWAWPLIFSSLNFQTTETTSEPSPRPLIGPSRQRRPKCSSTSSANLKLRNFLSCALPLVRRHAGAASAALYQRRHAVTLAAGRHAYSPHAWRGRLLQADKRGRQRHRVGRAKNEASWGRFSHEFIQKN